jgi:hypothetical protein
MKTNTCQFVRWTVLAVLLVFNLTASAFYDPHIGRWISRDPIGEGGGIENQNKEPETKLIYTYLSNDAKTCYCFVFNNGVNWFDVDGKSAAQPNTTSSNGIPRYLSRSLHPANPSFPRCTNSCGIYLILIVFDETVTDAANMPVSGLSLSENITYVNSYRFLSFPPGTGTATTDSQGKFSDTYMAYFSSRDGYLEVKQTITGGGKTATWFTFLTASCSWNGTSLTDFH